MWKGEIEDSVRYPSGDAKQATGYTFLKLRGRAPSQKCLNLRHPSTPNHNLPSLYLSLNQHAFWFHQDLNSHPPSSFSKSGSHLLSSLFFSPAQTQCSALSNIPVEFALFCNFCHIRLANPQSWTNTVMFLCFYCS